MKNIIELDATCGNTIENCIKEAKAKAIDNNATVWFMFNQRKVTVTASTDVKHLLRDYNTSWIMGWKEIGPDCDVEYSADLQEEIKEMRAIQEAESNLSGAKRRREHGMKVRATNAKLLGLELQLTDVDKWNEGKAANNDGYGGAVYIFAEQWGKLMQAEIATGLTVKDVAERTSHDADTVGLSGFQYGCAVQILSQLWVHGEDLRKWHNKQYGVDEDAKGTVNPAILTIGSKEA